MKKILAAMLSLVMLLSVTWIPASADAEISVYLDGTKIEFDVKPQIINNRTMVPIRAIFEKMGAIVDWDQSTSTAISTKNDTVVRMTVDSTNMYVNDQLVQMDVSPVVIDGRTLAPARFVAEAFGATVDWDQINSAVIISSMVTEEHYYNATNEVNQINSFIASGMYIEAIQLCESTLHSRDLSEDDKALISAYKTQAENLYNTYLYNEQNKATTTTPVYANPSNTQTTNNPTADGNYYRTPTGKKYHLDPNCGGKNSYKTNDISGLSPCAKCAK